jgi:hypothetical protein
MKLRGFVFVVAVLLLSACVTGVPTTPTAVPTAPAAPVETVGPGPQEPAGSPYPAVTLLAPPAQAYPAATAVVTAAAGSLYPDFANGTEVTWEQASSLVFNQEVTKATQSHDAKVYLTLKDGRTLVTTEPKIDDIMMLIKQCGDPCSTITIATE